MYVGRFCFTVEGKIMLEMTLFLILTMGINLKLRAKAALVSVPIVLGTVALGSNYDRILIEDKYTDKRIAYYTVASLLHG